MEPVRDPDLYRCAAGMAGVYDLSKMYKWGSIRHGEYGIKKFCRPESLVITRVGGKRELLWYPYTEKRRNLLRRLSRVINARGLGRFSKDY